MPSRSPARAGDGHDRGSAVGPGRRSTRQRSAISAILAQSPGFRSAQALHQLLRAQGQKIGLATVYRTLHSLTLAGECDVIRSGQGETLYRRCATRAHHHHLVCRHCGRTAEITSPAVARWIAQAAAAHGYRDIEHVIEIAGTCPACTAARGTNALTGGTFGPDQPQRAADLGNDRRG
jgi:Fur family transcriptional regulator, ferric uptake regulator